MRPLEFCHQPPESVLILLGNQSGHPSLGGVADLRIRAELQTFHEIPQGCFNALVGAGLDPISLCGSGHYPSSSLKKIRSLLCE